MCGAGLLRAKEDDSCIDSMMTEKGGNDMGGNMRTGRLRFVVLLPVIVALVMGCSAKAPEKVEKIVIGAARLVSAAPIWVAENKGYFGEEGLTVEIKEFDLGLEAFQAMLKGEGVDIATAAQLPIVAGSFKRSDFAIISSMMYTDAAHKVLVRKDRGVKVPSDLKGKTVGTVVNTSAHYYLAQFLVHYGLHLSDVKIVSLPPASLTKGLAEGQVDAVATWEPNGYETQRALGDRVFVLPGEGVTSRTDFYFVARKDFIKNHSQALIKLLKAIERGDEFIAKHKTEAISIVEHRLKLDGDLTRATWDDYRFRLFLDQPILTALEDQARWAIRNRLTDETKMPNYLDFLYTDALKEVKPGAVTIVGK